MSSSSESLFTQLVPTENHEGAYFLSKKCTDRHRPHDNGYQRLLHKVTHHTNNTNSSCTYLVEPYEHSTTVKHKDQYCGTRMYG